ncbi:hypothetical protein AB4144_39730, partial [Rhizobiaceae sp. 2RAB30]
MYQSGAPIRTRYRNSCGEYYPGAKIDSNMLPGYSLAELTVQALRNADRKHTGLRHEKDDANKCKQLASPAPI